MTESTPSETDPRSQIHIPVITRVLKTVLYPLRRIRWALRGQRYNTKEGYREDTYWEDRHRKFEGDFRAVASYSEEESFRYPRQRDQLLEILAKHDIKIEGRNAVEFGCGNGFWGGVMLSNGASSYTGIDISPTAVDYCRRTYPSGTFLRHHLGESQVNMSRTFDLVFSIDVTQHVVERDKLMRFLNDMQDCAEPGSLIFCTSYITDNEEEAGVRKKSMNVNFVVPWSVNSITAGFNQCELVQIHTFWDKSLLVLRKNS